MSSAFGLLRPSVFLVAASAVVGPPLTASIPLPVEAFLRQTGIFDRGSLQAHLTSEISKDVASECVPSIARRCDTFGDDRGLLFFSEFIIRKTLPPERVGLQIVA